MGLINNEEPVAEQPPEQPTAQPPEQPEQPTEQPKGDSNPVVARVAAAGAKLLYTEQTTQAVLEMIRKAPSPDFGLAQATTLIMGELVKKSNNTIPQEARVPAAKEIMWRIAELGEAAGLIENPKQVVDQASALIARELMKAMQQGKPAAPGQPAAPPAATPEAAAPEQPPVAEEMPV